MTPSTRLIIMLCLQCRHAASNGIDIECPVCGPLGSVIIDDGEGDDIPSTLFVRVTDAFTGRCLSVPELPPVGDDVTIRGAGGGTVQLYRHPRLTPGTGGKTCDHSQGDIRSAAVPAAA